MLKDIILLIIGALLGYSYNIYKFTKKVWIKKIITSRKESMEKLDAYQWLIEYYKKNKSINDLFDCKLGELEVKLPFVTKPEWQFISPITNITKDDILVYSETVNNSFEINRKLIEKRRALGQELFDEPTLYLDRIEIKNGKLKLHTKKCRYFEMATNLFSLEEETIRSINKKKETPIRDTYFADAGCCEKLLKKPFSLGCTTALVLKVGNSWEIVLHKRSERTVTYGNKLAVIPNYGLTIPFRDCNTVNLLWYNFLKEYCEELYDYEEIIKIANTNKNDPFWFYNLPENVELMEMFRGNKSELYYLGFGFDLFNGTSNIALAAIVYDENYVIKLKNNIKTNWEVKKDSDFNAAPLLFVDYKDKKLQEWLTGNEYQYGSAFTLAKTIDFLENNY